MSSSTSAAGPALVSGLPDGVVPAWVAERGGVADAVHWAAAALCTPDGVLHASVGDPDLVALLRSSAKPFQAIAFLRRRLDERLRLDDAAVACACASHEGEPRHLAAARRLLSAAGLTESQLLCGVHDALDPDLRAAVARGDVELSPIHNNCSGKHAAMLATCLHEGWPTATYTEADHPLQRENLETLAAFAGVDPESIRTTEDNCTVPAFALPLRAAALAAARLGCGAKADGLPPELAELAEAGARACASMVAAPGLVGGRSRLDSALMEATAGRLVAKTGANGYYLVAEREPPHRGLVVKLATAEVEPRKAPIVLALLAELDLVSAEEGDALRGRFDGVERGCRGAEVGSGRLLPCVTRLG